MYSEDKQDSIYNDTQRSCDYTLCSINIDEAERDRYVYVIAMTIYDWEFIGPSQVIFCYPGHELLIVSIDSCFQTKLSNDINEHQ
jgi:hypothetical protein